jgi:ABC-2 type transport system permease protein
VARREIVVKLTDRAFLVGTVLTLTLISGFMVVQTVLEQRAQTYAVAAMPEAQAMARTLEQRVGAVDGKVKVTVHVVTSVDAAQAALRDGSADVWLRHGGGGWVLTGKDGVPGGLDAAASTVIRQDGLRANAAALGVSVDEMTRGTTLTTSVLDGNAEKNGFAHGMGFALAFLFYLSSLGFGVTLAQSVLEEKQSRIVEIIATKIPVRQLLAGKVLGNTTMALGQMGLYVSIGLIGLSFTKYSTFLPGVSGALGWFLVFFLVGFLLIACAWAVAGALASRSEDLQQTSAPLTMLMVAVFFGAIFLKGTALTILSFIPPFSAVLMPIRVLSGSAAWWEPVVAVGLLMAAAVGGVLVAERLYRRSLLQTQGRLSLRQAWSSPDLATAPR